jgi:hypothetical protein
MICHDCAVTANENRLKFDNGNIPQASHPTDCGCACMHKPAEEWEKQFSVTPPWVKKVQETDVL